MGHSCGTTRAGDFRSLQKSHVKSPKRAFRTRSPKVTRQVSKTSISRETSSKTQSDPVCKTSVSYETSLKSHTSSLQNERFVRDFLQKSHVKSPKRAFRTRLPPKLALEVSKTFTRQVSKTERFVRDVLEKSHVKSLKRTFHMRLRLPPKTSTASLQNERFVRDFLHKSCVKSPKRAFHTRFPPKGTCPVSKTSVSYETPSKTHLILQNEHFGQDFLQKSSAKSPKRALHTRFPPKGTRPVSKTSVLVRDILQK